MNAQNGTMGIHATVTASTMIARFNFGRKVRCHRVCLWKTFCARAARYAESFILTPSPRCWSMLRGLKSADAIKSSIAFD
jgi:hypothetical protein